MSERNGIGLWPFIVENYILLIAGTMAALLWANLNHHLYEQFAEYLRFPINDIGMAFFFALATKEIVEATLPGGALGSPRKAGVPLLAAVGGMAGPAILFKLQVVLAHRPEMTAGWAIPCATDIAFSYMVARFIFPKNHPAIPFLLLLAIADDALGLILLAFFYPAAPLSLAALAGFMAPALGIAFWLKRSRVRNFWPYILLGGGLSWAGLFFGGFHPALALVPILPFMPHPQRDAAKFHLEEHGIPDTMNRFEHWWNTPVQIILFFFGLINGGVEFSSIGAGTWIVLISLLLGKPLGILIAAFLAAQFGLHMPAGLSYRHTAVLGVAAGIGFTVALFFATAAFAPGRILDEAKMGALLSFLAAPVAIVLGRMLRVSARP